MTERVNKALDRVRGLEAAWAQVWTPEEWDQYCLSRLEDCEARVEDLSHDAWLDAWDDLMEGCD